METPLTFLCLCPFVEDSSHGLSCWHDLPQIIGPAQQFGDAERTARGNQLPTRHEGKDAEETAQPDSDLMGLDKRLHL